MAQSTNLLAFEEAKEAIITLKKIAPLLSKSQCETLEILMDKELTKTLVESVKEADKGEVISLKWRTKELRMYNILITKRGLKSKRKLDKKVESRTAKEIDKISKDPYQNELLEPPFREYGIRTAHFSFKGISFRIAYKVYKEKKQVVILYIGPREIFYQKLKRIIWN